jgi:U3 small nucleolar RNA-associated protein 25
MQSLASESAPQPKRRKLDHPTESSEAKELAASDSEVVEQGEDADIVEEDEEGPETATEGLLEDDDDEENASDPFEAHFADPEDNLLAKRLKAVQSNSWTMTKTVLPKFGKVVMSLPETDIVSGDAAPTTISGPRDLKIKQKLAGVVSKQRPTFDPLEKSMAAYMFNYRDILYCERNPTNSDSLRRLACLHAVNHVFK